jgi:hypothetical protein
MYTIHSVTYQMPIRKQSFKLECGSTLHCNGLDMSWHEFISGLARYAHELPQPLWQMSDGAAFHEAIPALADGLAEQDHDLADFVRGYKLHEIIAAEFDFQTAVQPSPPSEGDYVREQLDTIEQLARLSNLIYRRKTDRIVIRGAYTC